MLLLSVYILVSLIGLTWIACDSGTIAMFELLRRDHHRDARDMGLYWSWTLTHVWRWIALLSFVAASAVLASLLMAQKPLQFDAVGRTAEFAVMLTGTLVLIPWIFVADALRTQRRLRSQATQLTRLAKLIESDPELARRLEPAGYDSEDSWTAWHPRQHNWHEGYWRGVVPVVYVRPGECPSIVIPLDWQLFLAWNLPAGIARPGHDLPFHGPGRTSFRVRSVYGLRRRSEWTVIKAELDDRTASVPG